MEKLLSKVTDAGFDPTSVSGEEAIILWNHVRQHVASTNTEKAHCYIISAEYRFKLKQVQLSIDELKEALSLLTLTGKCGRHFDGQSQSQRAIGRYWGLRRCAQ